MNAFSSIIGQSAKLRLLIDDAKKIAKTGATVLVTGETGTGKEVLVEAIRNCSPLRDKPYIALNCAALPESIVESELFGHTRGSFTGAVSERMGMLQAADGGTVFLDEIDSLSLPVQAKLLRFLENRECRQIGSVENRKVNVRMIAASNANLEEKIRAGEFREDLYFRLNVVRLDLPPLRERSEDLEHLINHFLQDFSHRHGLAAPALQANTLAMLRRFSWPGNIRQLRNLCESLCILHSGSSVSPADLPGEYNDSMDAVCGSAFSLPETGVNLELLEIDLINQALERTRGNRTKTARLLGISRYALHYRMQKHDIEVAIA